MNEEKAEETRKGGGEEMHKGVWKKRRERTEDRYRVERRQIVGMMDGRRSWEIGVKLCKFRCHQRQHLLRFCAEH